PGHSLSRRSLLRGAAAVAGGAALTACNTDINNSGGAGKGGGGGGGGDTKVGSGSVNLNQWYHQYGEKGTHEAVVRYAKKFAKAHSGISVKVGWNPGDYEGKLSTALLKGGPDVFELGQPTLDMVNNNQVEPLDDLYTAAIKKDFNPIVLDRITINNKIYAVPIVLDTGVLYYRKSLLSKAKVDPPETIDDLIAAAKKLTQGKSKGLFLGNDGGVEATQGLLPWSAGVSFMDGEKLTFNNDKSAAAYEKLVELNKTGALLQGFTTDYLDPSAFTQGACAMQWTGLWAMPQIQKELGDDFGVVPWPKMTGVSGATPATFIGGWQEMVNPKSGHVDDAKELTKWMWLEQKDIQKDFNLSYGFHVPPRQSAAHEAKALQTGPAADAASILDKYGNVMSNLWTDSMNTYLTNGVSRMVKKGADIQSQLGTIEHQCQQELKKELG
ncbi:MAG: ABC transporter substrate-binding protein, partial [Nocardioidaceae bacterium]